MDNWIHQYPGLGQLFIAHQKTFIERNLIIEMPSGRVIFSLGKNPEDLLLLLDRVVREQQVSENDRESRELATACLLAYENYDGTG